MDESNIPIDINTNKLIEWLISRRHVSKDWQNNILKIREKINTAIQDMPAHDGIVKLLSGQHINYFHCVKIIEILKETEADTKNLFGRYGSQRMKDWQDIVSCYQQDNIYLAEAAQLMMRNVSYEVPSLKKQIAKCEQAQQDCEKKIKDYTRAETIAMNDFASTCKQLGIKGDKLKSELVELLKELPLIYKRMDCNSLQGAIDMYKAFVNFHSGKDDNLPVLPILSYLVNYGNTTTYEYTYGEKPVSVEEPGLDLIDPIEITQDESANIDFGDDVQIDFSSLNTENEIDFGESPLNEGDIDWGTTSTTEEEFEIVDIDINLEESGIVVENSGLDGGVAKGNDAYTILDNPKTRDQIINDLMELNAFLKMRLYEMSSSSDLLMSQLDGSTIMQMQTIEGVTALADHVGIALTGLTNKRILHLHNIKHSPKYVDMLTASLNQKLEVVDRMKTSKGIIEEKMVENANQIKNVNPIIKQVIEKTKVLQKQIEEDISKKYKGRVVNVVGAVNQM